MRWSFRVGKIFGIEFRIHVTFVIFLLFIYLFGLRKGAGVAINGVIFVSAVFASVLIHEIGHSLIARKFGKEAKSITLLPIGGVATIEEIPKKPVQEIIMSGIGPLINIAIAGILFLIVGSTSGFSLPKLYPETSQEFFAGLIGINLILAAFNLLPAFPMDGGRMLRGILSFRFGFVRATKIAVYIGQFFALIFIFYGIFFNFMLAIIGLFLYLGAGGKKQHVMMDHLLNNINAKDVMSKKYEEIAPDETISSALEKIYHGYQDDFPVVENGEIKGILYYKSILNAIQTKSVDVRVEEVMDKNFIYTEPDNLLNKIYQRMTIDNKTAIAVIQKGRLIGMINQSGISRYFMIKSALQDVQKKTVSA